MAPAVDPSDGADTGMIAQVVVGDQDDARGAVGHLAAVETTQPAFDDGVDLVVDGRVAVAPGTQVGNRPIARLRIGVRLGVGEIQRGDRAQVRLVQAVPLVVFVGDPGEHARPHERGVGALVPDPRRSAEVSGGGVARHRLLQLDADHQRGLVRTGPEIGDRSQRRNAAGGARRLVARRRCVP